MRKFDLRNTKSLENGTVCWKAVLKKGRNTINRVMSYLIVK